MGCKECNQTGYKKVIKNGEGYLEPCSCKEKEESIKRQSCLIQKSNIPPIYKNSSFDQFYILEKNTKLGNIYEKSTNLVQSYLRTKEYEKGVGLYIFGPSNSGKTFLSSLICLELLRKNLKGDLFLFSDFLDNISNDWSSFLREVKKFDFLCLDRFHVKFNRNLFGSYLEDLIVSYFENKKTLIINSQCSIDSLKTDLFEFVPIIERFLVAVSLPAKYEASQILKLRKEYNY